MKPETTRTGIHAMRNRDWSAPRLCNAARSSRSIIGGTTMVKTRTAIIIRRLAFTRKTVEEAGWGRAVPSLRQRVDNGYAAHGAVSTTFQAGLKSRLPQLNAPGWRGYHIRAGTDARADIDARASFPRRTVGFGLFLFVRRGTRWEWLGIRVGSLLSRILRLLLIIHTQR